MNKVSLTPRNHQARIGRFGACRILLIVRVLRLIRIAIVINDGIDDVQGRLADVIRGLEGLSPVKIERRRAGLERLVFDHAFEDTALLLPHGQARLSPSPAGGPCTGLPVACAPAQGSASASPGDAFDCGAADSINGSRPTASSADLAG